MNCVCYYILGMCVLAYDFVYIKRLYDIREMLHHKSTRTYAKITDDPFVDKHCTKTMTSHFLGNKDWAQLMQIGKLLRLQSIVLHDFDQHCQYFQPNRTTAVPSGLRSYTDIVAIAAAAKCGCCSSHLTLQRISIHASIQSDPLPALIYIYIYIYICTTWKL